MRIVTVEQMRDMEFAANAGGYTYSQMMEAAGAHVADLILDHMPGHENSALVLVGPGNNGSDGLVAARLLALKGIAVHAWLSRPREKDETLVESAVEAGVELAVFDNESEAKFRSHCASANMIVDALLGTGAQPPLRGNILAMIKSVGASLQRSNSREFPTQPDHPSRPVIIAVDGPSGLDFDTGDIDDHALNADISVTFAAPKWGHVLGYACDKIGDLIVADIGIVQEFYPTTGPCLTTPIMIRNWLPQRSCSGHKGSHGKILIAAGSVSYTGAAVLASLGAYRTGAGLVTLALPASLHSAVVSAIPEATFVLLPESLGTVNDHAASVLQGYLDRYSALLVGPGLNNTRETQDFLQALLTSKLPQRKTGFLTDIENRSHISSLPPMVLDADGLNIVSQWEQWWEHLPADTILTPHPGEMARLTHLSIADIQANRLEVAQQAAQQWGHIVVLKGAFTIVAAPNEETIISPFATSALGTAGSGDVLAGIIVTLLGQGCQPFQAAVCGVYIHALAGTLASQKHGSAGVIARDIANFTGKAIKSLI